MLTIIINPKSGVPVYEQIYKFIRKEIETGKIKAGEKLPSKRKLAAHLKVGLVTVETAYGQLLAEGYIRSEPKIGYFAEPIKGLKTRGREYMKDTEITDYPYKTEEKYTYDFKTNTVDTEEFPFATWAKISRKILSENRQGILNPIDFRGLWELRKEIAKYIYSFRGMDVSPEQIIVGAGSEYLISMTVKLLGMEKLYAVENPGYYKIQKIFKSSGVEVRPIGLDKYGILVKDLERSGADVVHVTPSHHFPLGIVMPVKRRLELIEWANIKDGRYIIEDDYDSEFRFSGKPIPALQGLTDSERVIYINTFAKSLTPSIRIGYMVLPKALLEKYNKELYFYSSTVPGFEQYTLAEFMKNGHFERHVSRMRNTYRERQAVLIDAITGGALGGAVEIGGRDAGLHLLLTVKNGMDEKELVESAKKFDTRVYGLSDYYEAGNEIEKNIFPEATVVAGFAGMKSDELKKAVKNLEKAWII